MGDVIRFRILKDHSGFCEKKSEQKSGRGFPSGPVVKIPRVHCRGPGFDPWSGKFCIQPGAVKNKYIKIKI